MKTIITDFNYLAAKTLDGRSTCCASTRTTTTGSSRRSIPEHGDGTGCSREYILDIEVADLDYVGSTRRKG